MCMLLSFQRPLRLAYGGDSAGCCAMLEPSSSVSGAVWLQALKLSASGPVPRDSGPRSLAPLARGLSAPAL